MNYSGTTYRSFMKWAGGKHDSIPHIMPHIPNGELFVDVFAGSGVVGLNVAMQEGSTFNHVIFNDINYDPLDAIHFAMNDIAYAAEAEALFMRDEANTEEGFYRIRKQFNSMRRGVVRAATFLYLNRHAYNGLVRYNSDWEHNAPFGRYKSIYFPKEELNAYRQLGLRFKAAIMESSYQTIMAMGRGAGAVYYCDPPYLRDNGFTSYSGFRFNQEHHEKLAKSARELANRGATVLISNHADAKFLYGEADDIAEWEVRHSISSKGNGRLMNKELLAIYRPAEYR